jgi:hypothetical protein
MGTIAKTSWGIEVEVYPSLPVIPHIEAERRIADHNAELWQEKRWMAESWFILDTDRGQFVAEITSASGGGRVSNPPDEKDFCNVHIEYALHYRLA